MTQEEKQILFKDLCARLLYGVKAQVRINANYVNFSDAHKPDSETWIGDIWGITTNKPLTAWVYSFITIYPCAPVQNMCSIADCKPYLRPMESMTVEELKEFVSFTSQSMHRFICESTNTDHWYNAYEEEDWLLAHHFDYRGLIEMGLALPAPEEMYKLNQ